MRILIVEDDAALAQQLAASFEGEGHSAEITADGNAGLAAAQNGNFDVLVVDRMLPERDGLSLVAQLRDEGNNVPVLILSALAQVDDRVTGLRAGGDDYLTKPYAFSELLARTEVLARRNDRPGPDTTLQVGNLTLDRIAHQAHRAGEDIALLPR
ncbi:MAG: response regulator transcription factor, partial [Pseudomonadota bacterium]